MIAAATTEDFSVTSLGGNYRERCIAALTLPWETYLDFFRFKATMPSWKSFTT